MGSGVRMQASQSTSIRDEAVQPYPMVLQIRRRCSRCRRDSVLHRGCGRPGPRQRCHSRREHGVPLRRQPVTAAPPGRGARGSTGLATTVAMLRARGVQRVPEQQVGVDAAHAKGRCPCHRVLRTGSRASQEPLMMRTTDIVLDASIQLHVTHLYNFTRLMHRPHAQLA